MVLASELLPSANTVIFDEAHQLPEIAAAFFGDTLSTRQVQELGRDSLSEAGHTAADLATLNQLIAAVEKGCMDLRLSLGDDGAAQHPGPRCADNEAVIEAGEDLLEALRELDFFWGRWPRPAVAWKPVPDAPVSKWIVWRLI